MVPLNAFPHLVYLATVVGYRYKHKHKQSIKKKLRLYVGISNTLGYQLCNSTLQWFTLPNSIKYTVVLLLF